MNDKVILACLVLFGLLAYVERDKWLTPKTEIVYVTPSPTPKPLPERHLAPEGTFYLVEYVSVRTPHGITGFEPGKEVRFVSANKDKGTLTVSDGSCQVDVGPMQITNDLDVAMMARRQDQDSQHQLQAAQQAAWQADLKARRQVDLDTAKDIAGLRTGNTVGGQTALNQESKAASSFDRADQRSGYRRYTPYSSYYGSSYYGSPYYYLNR